MADPQTSAPSTPLIGRLWAWSQERFPLAQGIFVAVLYATGLLFGRYLVTAETLSFDWQDVLGFFACWAVFLMLRVFDEHKDYEEDLQNHPERVLQSGQITLGHLKVLGVLAVLGQGAFSMWVDSGLGSVTVYWLAVLIWSGLMAVEFFVPRWLNEHFVIYGASHMLVMVFVLAWLMRMGADGASLTTPAWWLAMLAFFAGCTYECTRKAWGAEEERETVGSYARVFGVRGVAVAIAVVMGLAQVASLGIVHQVIGLERWWWAIAPLLGWILVVLTVLKYAKSPTAKTRKANEAVVGLGMLAAYATPLTALIVSRGVGWVS